MGDQNTEALNVTPLASKPWERFGWSLEQQARIYRDLGGYLSNKEQSKIAEKSFDNCLKIDPYDPTALIMRSHCKRKVANIKSALEDALAAADIKHSNPEIEFTICKCLHENNEFEKCKALLHDNLTKHANAVVKIFLEHIDVVDQNLNDCLGESYGYFMLKQVDNLEKLIKNLEVEDNVKKVPLWKILKQQNECDVLSIPDVKEILLSPREKARRERWFRIYNQIYFGRNWADMNFMHSLLKNEAVSPTPALSKQVVLDITRQNYTIAKNFVNMLHARSPLYNEWRKKFKDPRLFKHHQDNYLNIVQYQTRRNMCAVLRVIKEYRKKGEVEKMTRYIEEVMGDCVVLKTHRIMPWKLEFINEVYNTLALAHADSYAASATYSYMPDSNNNLRLLLKIPLDQTERNTYSTFPKRKTYFDTGINNEKEAEYHKFLSRLEKRKTFAKFSIERCYLLYEMGQTYLQLGRCDMCCSAARKAIEETKICNNSLWRFLNMMLIVKAYATMRKIENCQKALEEADKMAKQLNDERLLNFIELASLFNDEDLGIKRKNQSSESIRKKSVRSETLLSSNEMGNYINIH